MKGSDLREARKTRELTLDELGKLLGITRQAVYQLEQREYLSPATTASVLVALRGFDGVETPACRPMPLDCPVCGHACDTGPATPSYVLTEHLRSAHRERLGGLVIPGAWSLVQSIPAYRLDVGDPGGPAKSSGGLTIWAVLADHPVVALPLPISGTETPYQWIPGSVREEGAQA